MSIGLILHFLNGQTIKTISMKKSIFLILSLVFATASFCQKQTVSKLSLTKSDYLKKSKKQKKTAWILLGGGAALVIIANVIPEGEQTDFNPRFLDYNHKNDGVKAAFGLTGGLSMLGSIPLFIASGKNRKKAKSASAFINMEKAPILQQTGIRNQSFPAVGVRISL